ncbi:hypothetical protein Pcac1_g29411 [Phytophthora cactorum]|nr:hypothetical protein Pcac1_g29411 [Phytophthora cactorum]
MSNFDESTFGLHRRFLMKMSTTWTSNRSTSTMMVPARRSTRRQGSARAARVTKMKLPEDRELCAIDLDWKKQVRRTTPLRTEQTQTKKKSMEMKMTIRLHQVFWRASANAVEAARSIGADDIPRSGETAPTKCTGAGDSC